jgi:predicted DNA-binding ribbon-helix-helix protein
MSGASPLAPRNRAEPPASPKSPGFGSLRSRRNIRISGRRTSLSLERAMWEALSDIGQRENRPLDALCTAIDERRSRNSLSSAIRTFVLCYFRAIARRLTFGSGRAEVGGIAGPALDEALNRVADRRRRRRPGGARRSET